MPMEAEKNVLNFWSKSAKGYKEGVEKELSDKNVNDKWVKKILDNAPAKKKLRILDIGTGPGFFTINFAKLGHNVTGVDVTREMVMAAKQNAKEQGVECDFRVMNANDLQFPDDTFDLVINRNVTWTIPDVPECYKEWKRVLSPGGRLIVFDGNYYANQFDPEKAKMLRSMMRKHLTEGGEPYTEHFDFHTRDSFWLTRPMVGTPRPEWDRNILFKLGYVNIHTEENLFHSDYEGDAISPMFMICAEKLSRKDEDECTLNEYYDGISPCVSARAKTMLENGKAAEYARAVSGSLPAGASVLDIGCGSGVATIALAEMGFHATGLDRSEAMIEMAEITAGERNSDAAFLNEDACNLKADDSYDAVLLRNVLWCSYEPERILSKAVKALKTGGRIVITDGNWLYNINQWEIEGRPFRMCVKRDLGFGGNDVINNSMNRLPLNIEARPEWDTDTLGKLGLKVEICEEFADPMVTDDIAGPLGRGFRIVAVKQRVESGCQ